MQQDHAIIRRRIYQSPAFQRLSGREQATVFLARHAAHDRRAQPDGRALLRKAIAAAPAMPSAYVLFGLSLLGGASTQYMPRSNAHAAFGRSAGPEQPERSALGSGRCAHPIDRGEKRRRSGPGSRAICSSNRANPP